MTTATASFVHRGPSCLQALCGHRDDHVVVVKQSYARDVEHVEPAAGTVPWYERLPGFDICVLSEELQLDPASADLVVPAERKITFATRSPEAAGADRVHQRLVALSLLVMGEDYSQIHVSGAGVGTL